MTTPVVPGELDGGRADRALVSLAWVTTQLASARSGETGIERVLANVRQTLGASELSVWLHTATGLVRRWSDGVIRTAEAEIRAVLPGGEGLPRSPGVEITAIVRADRPLGALVARLGRPTEPEERLLLSSVTSLLALELTHSERSRRLEEVVADRTDEIERGRRFMETILDSLPVGLFVVDRDYRVQSWNGLGAIGLAELPRESALGQEVGALVPTAEAVPLREELRQVFETGRLAEVRQERIVRGEPRTFRITRIPMRTAGAAVTHVITIGEDITDWSQAQERYSQAEKLAAIGQLVAGVMHEINNPLATIAACAESLGYRMDDLRASGVALAPETQEYLEIIDNEVQRSKRIVDGLLDFSRPSHPRRERVHPSEVVEQTLFLLQHHVRFRRLAVRTSLDPMVGRVPNANSEQLVQVLMALLINASDAIGAQGTVEVATRPGGGDGPSVTIAVSDDGKGIPRSELDRIFEPFYTTKAPGEGTGLGLSICYAIVQEHGGRIEVDSAEGVGTTFRVILPVVGA